VNALGKSALAWTVSMIRVEKPTIKLGSCVIDANFRLISAEWHSKSKAGMGTGTKMHKELCVVSNQIRSRGGLIYHFASVVIKKFYIILLIYFIYNYK
jgi:hypothetical protein